MTDTEFVNDLDSTLYRWLVAKFDRDPWGLSYGERMLLNGLRLVRGPQAA